MYCYSPAKYRRAVITKKVDEKLKKVCEGIEARYEIKIFGDRNREGSYALSGVVSDNV
jgi:hypothetical protein